MKNERTLIHNDHDWFKIETGHTHGDHHGSPKAGQLLENKFSPEEEIRMGRSAVRLALPSKGRMAEDTLQLLKVSLHVCYPSLLVFVSHKKYSS